MIKLVKLCFVCCLVFVATFVEAVITKEEAYEALKIFEAEFWRNTIYPYYQDQLGRHRTTFAAPECLIAQNVFEYLDPICKDGLAELFDPNYENFRIDFRNADRSIDFSNASMLDIISVFYEILQCKVKYRDKDYATRFRGDIWNITFDEDHYALDKSNKRIDPYFLELIINKNRYFLHLDYDGSGDQPGNCCIVQSEDAIVQSEDAKCQSWCNYGREYNSLLNNSYYVLQNLLLCLEVSRRKVVDPERTRVFLMDDGSRVEIPGFKDIYCELPILGAIVIGLELMNDQIINRDDFFVTGRQYCCFSNLSKDRYGNYIPLNARIQERENHIGNLLQDYCRYKNFQTVDQFLEEVQVLYKQFIGLRVIDRVLYLDENNKSIIQKYASTQMGAVRRTLSFCDYHIVDVNSNKDHSLWFSILQNMNPEIYYYRENPYNGLLDKDFQWEPKKESQVKILKFLEENFQKTVVVLDTTVTDNNCTKWLSSEDESICECYYLNGASYKQAIILLWRGDRWQAVLPDHK